MKKTSEHPLELSGEEFRELVNQTTERIMDFIGNLEDRPMMRPPSNEVLSSLKETLPEHSTAPKDLLNTIFNDILSSGLENASHGNMAYIPGGGLPQAAVADMLTAAINRYVSVWALSPGLAELEATVIRWFGDIFNFPLEMRGILTSGASLSIFSAIVTARHDKLGEDLNKAAAYMSDVGHYAVPKTASLAGLPSNTFHMLKSNDQFQLPPDELRRKIQADRQAGLRPFLIVATAGATRTGSVDDLEALAEIAREENLWLHVDAAYGGLFYLTQRGRKQLKGIEQVDSITIDPHKSLFLPYGTGVLLVKDGTKLRASHINTDQRYSPRQDNPDRIDFCEYSPELSREARGLRVWLPIKMHGIGAFRDALNEKLDLIEFATQQLKAMDGIEIFSNSSLSIVTFRYIPKDGLSPEELDVLQHKILNKINARQNVHLMGVTLRERFVLRFCILSFRTHQNIVEEALDDLKSVIKNLQEQALT